MRPLLALAALGLPLVLAACGGQSAPAGLKRVTGGGAAVLVPSSFYVNAHPKPPDVIQAADTAALRPNENRLGVATDSGLGNLGQIAAEDLHSNTLRLVDRRVTSDLKPVKVPGAKEAMQGEYEFTSGFQGGSKRWRTHVWVRYATTGSHSAFDEIRVYALSVVVPSVAKHKPDVPAILKSFELTG